MWPRVSTGERRSSHEQRDRLSRQDRLPRCSAKPRNRYVFMRLQGSQQGAISSTTIGPYVCLVRTEGLIPRFP